MDKETKELIIELSYKLTQEKKLNELYYSSLEKIKELLNKNIQYSYAEFINELRKNIY
jgi:hypothetical protein